MKILRPLKAIRAKCLDCACGQTKEIALCAETECALHPYRFGERPKEGVYADGIEFTTALSDVSPYVKPQVRENRYIPTPPQRRG